MTLISDAQLLLRVPLFAALTPEQRQEISQNVIKERLKKDVYIVKQGAMSDALHVFLIEQTLCFVSRNRSSGAVWQKIFK